ncbi:MAG: AAA family ATPase [Nitrospirota bacterium]
MYESFYGFRAKPFSLSPDPEFLYLGDGHRMALNLLEYGLLNQAGFVIITGGPGTGKTTLLHSLLDQYSDIFAIGMLTNVQDTLGSLLPWIVAAFGLSHAENSSVGLFSEFSAFLAREHARRRRVLLVVDEAQNLTPTMVEELRLLSNVNDGRGRCLQVILSGQPPLRALLQRADMTQFAQRVAVDCHLDPLSEDETPGCIRHRLGVAGGRPTLFSDGACVLAHRVSGGVPRLINQVCDTALAYGFAEQTPRITATLVAQAALARRRGGILPLRDREDLITLAKEWDQKDSDRSKGPAPGHGFSTAEPGSPPIQDRRQTGGHIQTAGTLYDRGLTLKKAGRFEEAVASFLQAAETPDHAFRAYAQAGLCLRAAGRLEDAAEALGKALDRATGSGQEVLSIRYLLGRTFESLGRRRLALDSYRHIARCDPAFRDVEHRLAQLSGDRATGRRAAYRTNGAGPGRVLHLLHRLFRSAR